MRYFPLLSLIFLVGCRSPQAPIAEVTTPTTEEVKEDKEEVAAVEIEESALPVFSEESFESISVASQYDYTPLLYHLLAPENLEEPKGVLLSLQTSQPLLDPSLRKDYWLVTIPSRPAFSFHWLAEAEFWQMLHHFWQSHPSAQNLPLYLVGQGEHAINALELANSWRDYFAAVIIDTPPSSYTFQNLDALPIIALSNENTKPYIHYLQSRGNLHAQFHPGTLTESLTSLQTQEKSSLLLPKYTFTDDRFSQVTPWLKVLGRITYSEPVTVEVLAYENELQINASNCMSLRIDLENLPGLRSSINTIRFNNALFTFSPNTPSLTIGNETAKAHWKIKSDTPSGFANFFQNEPLYIVYQTQEAPIDYLKAVAEFADSLSTFTFQGLAPLKANITKVPLEDYHPHTLPSHRAIIIGQQPATNLLFSSQDTFPLKQQNNTLSLYRHQLELPSERIEQIAYSLIHPSEQFDQLKLGMLMVAEDSKGISALSSFFTSATTLFYDKDFSLWTQVKGEYQFSSSLYFNAYWNVSTPTDLQTPLPSLSTTNWENYLQEILEEESESLARITTPSIGEYGAPTHLDYQKILSLIPPKRYAKIRLQGNRATNIGNRILKHASNTQQYGLQNHLTWNKQLKRHEFNRSKMKKGLTLTVEIPLLDFLTPQELSWIEFQPLPYSLQEMVWQRVQQDPGHFGKQLLKAGV